MNMRSTFERLCGASHRHSRRTFDRKKRNRVACPTFECLESRWVMDGTFSVGSLSVSQPNPSGIWTKDTIDINASPVNYGSSDTTFQWTITNDANGAVYDAQNSSSTDISTTVYVAGTFTTIVIGTTVEDDGSTETDENQTQFTVNAVQVIGVTADHNPVYRGDIIDLTPQLNHPPTSSAATVTWDYQIAGQTSWQSIPSSSIQYNLEDDIAVSTSNLARPPIPEAPQPTTTYRFRATMTDGNITTSQYINVVVKNNLPKKTVPVKYDSFYGNKQGTWAEGSISVIYPDSGISRDASDPNTMFATIVVSSHPVKNLKALGGDTGSGVSDIQNEGMSLAIKSPGGSWEYITMNQGWSFSPNAPLSTKEYTEVFTVPLLPGETDFELDYEQASTTDRWGSLLPDGQPNPNVLQKGQGTLWKIDGSITTTSFNTHDYYDSSLQYTSASAGAITQDSARDLGGASQYVPQRVLALPTS